MNIHFADLVGLIWVINFFELQLSLFQVQTLMHPATKAKRVPTKEDSLAPPGKRLNHDRENRTSSKTFLNDSEEDEVATGQVPSGLPPRHRTASSSESS